MSFEHRYEDKPTCCLYPYACRACLSVDTEFEAPDAQAAEDWFDCLLKTMEAVFPELEVDTWHVT